MKHADYKDRKGKFAIDCDIIDNGPQYAQAIMAEVVVVRAEAMHHSNLIEYHAYSKHFREIPFGEIIPTYTIVVNVTYDDDGKEKAITLAFKEAPEPGAVLRRDQLVEELNAPGRWTGPACLGPAADVDANARHMTARQLVALALGRSVADIVDVTVDPELCGTVQALVKLPSAVGGSTWQDVPLPLEDWQQCVGEPPPSKL